MELIDKANILADYLDKYQNDPTMVRHVGDLMVEWDLSWYLSAGLSYGVIKELSLSGEKLVSDLWDAVLAHYDIADVEYSNLAELAGAAGFLDGQTIYEYNNVVMED